MVKRKKKITISASSCRASRQKLPDGLKEKFGTIAFVKWTCAHSPVLIVDPMQMVLSYTLPEGIYHAWLHQVHLHSSVDDDALPNDSPMETPIDMLPVLIYWYGTCHEFSIVRLSQIIEWEVGCEKGYNILPKFMSRRIQRLHRPVPAVYSLLDDALVKVQGQALALVPEERSLAIFPPGTKKKQTVVLNEWHALAMEAPPQQHSWMEQKQAMEAALPHPEWFGEIAFLPHKCGHYDYHHPVLVMNPFRVPPNQRAEWFHKCSSGELVMVYWLGSYTSGRVQQNVYTYHKLSELIPYQEGVKLGYKNIPKQVVKDYGNPNLSAKRLAQIDCWVCGTEWELPHALEKEPKDRWGGLEDFEEDHDDDFEYFWECLTCAKEAQDAKGKVNGTTTSTAAIYAPPPPRPPRAKPSEEEEEILDDTETEEDDDNDDDDNEHDEDVVVDNDDDDDDDDEEAMILATKSAGASLAKSKRVLPQVHGFNKVELFDDSDNDRQKSSQRKRRKKSERSLNDQDQQEVNDRTMEVEYVDNGSGMRQETKKVLDKFKKSSGKLDGSPIVSTSRVNTFPLREEIEEKWDVSSSDDETTKKQAAVPRSKHISLHEELDNAVQKSISHCAAILSEGREPTSPRSAKQNVDGLLSQSTKNGVTGKTHNYTQDRRRQQQATEQVVKDVIQQWTQVRLQKK